MGLQVKSSVKYSFELITPELAAQYQKTTPAHNRKLRPVKVTAMAKDMRNGHWEDNGESIKFDTNGQLVDGQHRMAAIEEAGVAIPIHVVRGVRPESIHTIDTGLARRYSDVIKLTGMDAGGNIMASAALHRRLFFYKKGYKVLRGVREVASNADLIEFQAKYEHELRLAMEAAQVLHRKRILSLATAATAFFVCAEASDLDTARKFFGALERGTDLPNGSPIFLLRDRLMRAKSERLTEDEKLALFYRAWNHWRDNQLVASLILTRTGLNDKNFPEPK